jgi:hypothetical protein
VKLKKEALEIDDRQDDATIWAVFPAWFPQAPSSRYLYQGDASWDVRKPESNPARCGGSRKNEQPTCISHTPGVLVKMVTRRLLERGAALERGQSEIGEGFVFQLAIENYLY